MPPTSIDGTDIMCATIDCTDVQAITVDGQTVFTAVVEIPDTSMFQSPLFQFTAVAGLSASDGNTASNWTEQLSSLGDATVEGAPTFRSDKDGFPAVEYDGVDDAHNLPTSGRNLPSGDSVVSFAATIYAPATATNFDYVFDYGNGADGQNPSFGLKDSEVFASIFGGGNVARGGNYPTGEWITIGGVAATDDLEAYLNGSSVATNTNTSENADFKDTNGGIGYSSAVDSSFSNVFVFDVVICDARESDQAFSDYHQDRLA